MSTTWELPPEPGPEVEAVRDTLGVRWHRIDDRWWGDIGLAFDVVKRWDELLQRGPLEATS